MLPSQRPYTTENSPATDSCKLSLLIDWIRKLCPPQSHVEIPYVCCSFRAPVWFRETAESIHLDCSRVDQIQTDDPSLRILPCPWTSLLLSLRWSQRCSSRLRRLRLLRFFP